MIKDSESPQLPTPTEKEALPVRWLSVSVEDAPDLQFSAKIYSGLGTQVEPYRTFVAPLEKSAMMFNLISYKRGGEPIYFQVPIARDIEGVFKIEFGQPLEVTLREDGSPTTVNKEDYPDFIARTERVREELADASVRVKSIAPEQISIAFGKSTPNS
jgi:hypothetical protein